MAVVALPSYLFHGQLRTVVVGSALLGGIPSGPSTSTILAGSVLVTLARLFDIGGSRRRRFTSGGMEMVAPPIREAHGCELEKGRGVVAPQNAGTRKSGIVAVGLFGFTMCSMHWRRMGDSMAAYLWCN